MEITPEQLENIGNQIPKKLDKLQQDTLANTNEITIFLALGFTTQYMGYVQTDIFDEFEDLMENIENPDDSFNNGYKDYLLKLHQLGIQSKDQVELIADYYLNLSRAIHKELNDY